MKTRFAFLTQLVVLSGFALITPCPGQTYDQVAYQGYVLYNKGLTSQDNGLLREAAGLLRRAAQLKGKEREPLLWDAAMIAAR
ncbi:MAG TPA: hypothetical protein VF646_05850, partial [Cytophagales bacterium]